MRRIIVHHKSGSLHGKNALEVLQNEVIFVCYPRGLSLICEKNSSYSKILPKNRTTKNYSLQTYMNIIPELVFFLFSIAISIGT